MSTDQRGETAQVSLTVNAATRLRPMLQQVLRRRGVDPDSADYQSARRHARAMLEAADGLHRDHTA